MDKLDSYKNELLSGVSAVVLGLLSKKVFKKEVLPVGDGRKIFETFLAVAVCAGLGEELNKQLKKYQTADPKA